MQIFGNDKKNQKWTLVNSKFNTSKPLKRSGHSLTNYRSNMYYMFGGTINGLEDPEVNKIRASDELWSLELSSKSFNWELKYPKGDIPSPRSNHIAVFFKKNDSELLLIHGGMNRDKKFDDMYLFECAQTKFTKVEFSKEDIIPSPRAHHSAYYINDKIYMYGGNGGKFYENSVFNDLWVLDLDTYKWVELKEELKDEAKVGNLPEPRTGHSMFVYNDEVYIYGGINQTTAYNNIIKFDLNEKQWNTFGIDNDLPCRWNHCAVDVESLPSWKYFIFGGSTGIPDDNKPRERGEVNNDVIYVDIGKEETFKISLDSDELPPPREDSAMIFNKVNKTLFIFGGWSNEWYNDIYSLNVTKIVGPIYTVKGLEPNEGRISGGQKIKVLCNNLINDEILACFYYLKDKEKNEYGTAMTTAVYVSDNEAELTTPDFEKIGAREVEFKIKIGNDEPSTNPAFFTIYLDAKAETSLAYGPGLCDGTAFNQPNFFIVRARNKNNENRESGRDKVEVSIIKDNEKIECQVEDLMNGNYKVCYVLPEAGTYSIDVFIEDENTSKY